MQNDSALKSPIQNHEKFPINTTLKNHFVLAISLIKNTALFIRTKLQITCYIYTIKRNVSILDIYLS